MRQPKKKETLAHHKSIVMAVISTHFRVLPLGKEAGRLAVHVVRLPLVGHGVAQVPDLNE